jgi:hypothetical protein
VRRCLLLTVIGCSSGKAVTVDRLEDEDDLVFDLFECDTTLPVVESLRDFLLSLGFSPGPRAGDIGESWEELRRGCSSDSSAVLRFIIWEPNPSFRASIIGSIIADGISGKNK